MKPLTLALLAASLCSFISTGTAIAQTPITITSVTVPDNNATLSGVVRMEVRGNGIANAELLPASGYLPQLGVFIIAPNTRIAALNFDSRSLPNGTLTARISAFNTTACTVGAAELVAMPPRTWTLNNDPPPAPTFIPHPALMPLVIVKFADLPYVDPKPLSDLTALSDAQFDALLTSNWPSVQATLLTYVPANVKFHPQSLSQGTFLVYSTCVGTGGRPQAGDRKACRDWMNSLIGLMNSKRPS